jgi:azurin
MIRPALIAVLLLASALPFPAAAATCSVELTGNDAMKYNLTNIDVSKSCKTFTIHLKHTGKLARNLMGHNVVVGKTADMAGIGKDAIPAGLAANYIKAGDARVIASSKVVGGGESTSVDVPVAKLVAAGAPLSFFCTFPGHSALMKGSITLKP